MFINDFYFGQYKGFIYEFNKIRHNDYFREVILTKIVYLKAKNFTAMGTTFQTLHQFFSQSIKEKGVNNYGVSFPEIKSDFIGYKICIICFHDVERLLMFKPLTQMMSSGSVLFEGVIPIEEARDSRYVAFIRDRRLERGSPPQAMSRMASSTSDHKEVIARATMSRYFETKLPQINMRSQSNQRHFTINIATVEATQEQRNQAHIHIPVFNSYGLSSYSNPVFVPYLEDK